MEKARKYRDTFFAVEVLERARRELLRLSTEDQVDPRGLIVHLSDQTTHWDHDDIEEFYADYRSNPTYVHFWLEAKPLKLEVVFGNSESHVTVKAPERAQIEALMRVFDDAAPASKILAPPAPPPARPTVFIGHGGSPLWRDLKDHLHEKHGYNVEAYEIGARAGHTIRDVLNSMLRNSTFAVLVMTGEDEHKDGTKHARENVIHELGLFQGRLGFRRAVVLLEEGTSEFSNIHGIHQIRFKQGNIKETYGEVLATLRREFVEP
jgi:predicted nucleotide-binding protein